MSRFTLPALLVLIVPALLAPTFQTRVKENKAADFPGLLTEASKQWNEQRYGGCIASLQEAVTLATEQRVVKIRAALPTAPATWEQVPDKDQNLQAVQGLAGFGALAGSMIERKWKQTEGRGSINVMVTADSPLVGMLGGYLTNPALLGENKELIEYGKHKAILETNKKGSRLNLQIIVDGKHIVDVKTTELTEDELFAMWNQAAVDKLSSALSF